jgi:transposase-like protein
MCRGNLYLLRPNDVMGLRRLRPVVDCPVCHARLFVGDLVGDLVGIDHPVCQSCWYYFQPL